VVEAVIGAAEHKVALTLDKTIVLGIMAGSMFSFLPFPYLLLRLPSLSLTRGKRERASAGRREKEASF
jgi:hypothetical protein